MPRQSRSRSHRLASLLATGVLTVAAATVGPAIGSGPAVSAAAAPVIAPPRVPGPTEAQLAALDPTAQAALLAPLREAAAALDAVGRRDAPAEYAGVALDVTDGRIELSLTDRAAAPRLVAAARRLDRGLTPHQVVVHGARYSLLTLQAASRAALGLALPFDVYAAYPAPDGSGVEVEVRNPAVAARTVGPRLTIARSGSAAARTGVGVRFVVGSPRVAHGWDAVKWRDTPPFIGGDVLTRDGHHYCTAGLPAVRVRDSHPVMVTAAHCFSVGQRVYTAAGRTWDYGNGRTGNDVGTVTKKSTLWDAELVDGASNAADESDTSGWKPLTSVAYSYRGDYVCHSGARSAAEGHPTPCGIKVTISDLYFREGGYVVRGVEGVDVHGWGSVNGDSGGTVFAVEPHGERQLRGLVSSGGKDGTEDQPRVDWPEAVDIFDAFGLKLNPST